TQEAMAESLRTRAGMEERARIARELHDIVAHHLSVIAIESEAARLTSPELSAVADNRLEAIASTAREALTETRRLLGVLREDTGGEADRTPQPGVAELDDLVDRARATGTRVRLTREGTIVPLPLSSISPRSGSSRKRSPTRDAMLRARTSTSTSRIAMAHSTCVCGTTGRERPTASRRRATA